jgi:hypothetical protein
VDISGRYKPDHKLHQQCAWPDRSCYQFERHCVFCRDWRSHCVRVLNGRYNPFTNLWVLLNRHSPAAFYAYSTVKIITVPAVTDGDGHKVCGTSSAFTNSVSFYGGNTDLLTFTSMNSNAQAYFGGLNIAGLTKSATYTTTITDTIPYSDYTDTGTWTWSSYSTYYVNSLGQPIPPQVPPTGVTISLTTPFIYQPERGAKGEDDEGQHCLQNTGTENYGYIPQTLLDFLIQNEQYSAQYPGLSSCLPGGPSIIQITSCNSVLPTVQYAGGDLTSSTVVIVTPPGAAKSQQQGPPDVPVTSNSPNPPASTPPIPLPNPPQSNAPNPPQSTPAQSPASNPPASNPPANNPTNNPPANNPPASSTTSLGAIINSIMGGQPPNTPAPQVPSPIIIPNPTTIPLNQAPPGLTGSTTVIGGSSFVVVPSATTILGQPSAPTYSTTLILGTPYILIPGPTNIPLSLAPSGLTGITSMISGTVFLLVPSSTSVPGPTLPGSMTVIGGTTELVISGPTTVPINPGLQLTGSTTVISGTTMVIISGTQTVPVETGASVLPSYVQISGGFESRRLNVWIALMSVGLGVLLGLR